MHRSFVTIDYDPDVIEILEHNKINYLYGDAMDAELLEEAGVAQAKLVVSTITDFEISTFLLGYLERKDSDAVIIAQADNAEQATKLYRLGASYVILPHYIGSEQISAFVKRSGLKKEAFKKFRAKHLEYLEEQYGLLEKKTKHHKKLGHAIVDSVASLTKAKA